MMWEVLQIKQTGLAYLSNFQNFIDMGQFGVFLSVFCLMQKLKPHKDEPEPLE